jgi:histidinol-phosphate aminotransferase
MLSFDTIDDRRRRLIRSEVQALKPYQVPDATGLIKLDAMENPYPWPDKLRSEWLEVMARAQVNRYPDPKATALAARLRQILDVPSGAGILLGNGSDELIQIVLMALAKPGAIALAPTPTFVMYEMIATFVGMNFVGVPLRSDFALDIEAMLETIRTHHPAVVFLSYPNNPTGNLFSAGDMTKIIEQAPGLVIVDEAYHAFAQSSFMERVVQYDHLLVMRTLSKQGLAGLRLGVLAGAAPWLQDFDKVRLPYNINSLTQASAEFALTHIDEFNGQCNRIRVEREGLYRRLAELPGIEVWPSRANFILFRTHTRPAGAVHAALRDNGILIKNLDAAGGLLRGCLRVTVGTPEENQAFLAALEKVL